MAETSTKVLLAMLMALVCIQVFVLAYPFEECNIQYVSLNECRECCKRRGKIGVRKEKQNCFGQYYWKCKCYKEDDPKLSQLRLV